MNIQVGWRIGYIFRSLRYLTSHNDWHLAVTGYKMENHKFLDTFLGEWVNVPMWEYICVTYNCYTGIYLHYRHVATFYLQVILITKIKPISLASVLLIQGTQILHNLKVIAKIFLYLTQHSYFDTEDLPLLTGNNLHCK